MLIGIPKEIKNNENRVALTPAGVHSLVGRGHRVLVETMLDLVLVLLMLTMKSKEQKLSQLLLKHGLQSQLLKVKEPLASEYQFLRDDLLLFTYLHMAAAPELADAMLAAKTTGVAYELYAILKVNFLYWFQ